MFSSIKEAADLARFAWIEEGLRSPVGHPPDEDTALRTLDMVPAQFAAYAKILHPVYEDPKAGDQSATWDQTEIAAQALGEVGLEEAIEGATFVRAGIGGRPPRGWRRALWSELAARLDLQYEPALSEQDLDRAWPGGSWPASLIGPDEGDLTPDLLRALVGAVLTEGDPGPCYFWWWLVACTHVFDPDDMRDFLFHGRLRDLPRFISRKKATAPTYWWPESHEWCVATDWDCCFTVMGGPRSLIECVLGSSEVEGFPVGPEEALLIYPDKK